MNIVRIATRLNVGGIAKHVSWLTSGLDHTCYSTTLVCGRLSSGEDDMAYFAENLGVNPLYNSYLSREISLNDLVAIWKLYRLFIKIRPSIVHTHAAKAGFVGRIAGFFYKWLTFGTLTGHPRKCKFVHTFHGHIFQGYYGLWKSRFFVYAERVLATLATDRIIVISKQQLHEILNEYRIGGSSQYRVIPLGIDVNVFQKKCNRQNILRKELGINSDVLLVGIVGRITEIKNHRFFVDVIHLWKQQNKTLPKTYFVIVGNGNLRYELECYVNNLRLESDIVFLGNRVDTSYLYADFDIVALTSKNEGTPLTLIEGMACECAVISTDVGGVADLLGNLVTSREGYDVCERGILVQPGDVESYMKGMNLLLEDSNLRCEMGNSGTKFIYEKYQKQRLIDDITMLYDELVDDDRSQKTIKTDAGGDTCVS